MEYFRAHGWISDPWKHAVLYELFDVHGSEYTPDAAFEEHLAFATRVARTLFDIMHVRVDPNIAAEHAVALWSILGPSHLTVFPDVEGALRQLRADNYRLVIVSNWQRGLGRFCDALGLRTYFEDIVVSAEVGFEKPDSRIFAEACRRLALPPSHVLHIGDSQVEDVDGARRAGLRAARLQRDGVEQSTERTVQTLTAVVAAELRAV